MKTTKIIQYIIIPLLTISCSNTIKSKTENEVTHPKFVVHPEIHNFGTIESGEVATFFFKLTNEGSGVLHIDSINYGCGCIETILKKDELKNGESTYLQVIFNSAGEWGNVNKPIIVHTNSAEKEKSIYISAKVNNQLFN